MKKINKVLFPTDFSDSAQNAFRHALFFADQIDAEIELFHVVVPQNEILDLPVVTTQATRMLLETARELSTIFIADAMTSMEKYIKQKPNVKSTVELGIPVSSIVKKARQSKTDLIIMGTNGEHNLVERTLGTVAQGVIAAAKCSVMVVPEDAQVSTYKTIAYSTDLLDADPYEIWRVTKLLSPLNFILRIVHFTQKKESDEMERLEDMKLFFTDHAPSLQTHFHHFPEKNLAADLNDFVATYDVDLLVMYQPYRNLVQRFFHRSHTQRMASRSEIPLLVIKETKH